MPKITLPTGSAVHFMLPPEEPVDRLDAVTPIPGLPFADLRAALSQHDPLRCLPCRASGCSRYFDQTQWRCAAGRFCRRLAFQERKL